MEIDSATIEAFLRDTHLTKEQMIEFMLMGGKTCGIREIWDYGRYADGYKIIVTYELDEKIPYGVTERIVKPATWEGA